MSSAAAATASAKWLRHTPLSYTTLVRPQAAPVPEASSPPASIPGPLAGLTVHPGRPIIRLHKEPFFVERDGDTVYIRHERWSLLGAGETLTAAYKDLLSEASDLAPVLGAMLLSTFDQDAMDLYQFVLRIA